MQYSDIRLGTRSRSTCSLRAAPPPAFLLASGLDFRQGLIGKKKQYGSSVGKERYDSHQCRRSRRIGGALGAGAAVVPRWDTYIGQGEAVPVGHQHYRCPVVSAAQEGGCPTGYHHRLQWVSHSFGSRVRFAPAGRERVNA